VTILVLIRGELLILDRWEVASSGSSTHFLRSAGMIISAILALGTLSLQVVLANLWTHGNQKNLNFQRGIKVGLKGQDKSSDPYVSTFPLASPLLYCN
jgi:hypothetical protein